MVTLINNVPCRHIDQFENDMEFILLHKILDNDKYRRYYLTTKQGNKKYKILDNGAYELGKGIDDKRLLEWAERLNVNEVIAPDIFKNKEKTMEKLCKFVEVCPHKFKIQAVPQGHNDKELMNCLNEMLMINVDVIGFNKLWDRHSLIFQEAVKRAYSMGKEIHMLGVNNLHDWTSFLKNPYIRSADSRILSKIVSGEENTWETNLDSDQIKILKRLHKEIQLWQR